MTLGNKLKVIRLGRGLSQADVAEHLNLTRQSISKWENNNGYPDLDNLVLLSKYYEISLDELLNENQDFKVTIENQDTKTASGHQNHENINHRHERDEGLALLLISLIGCLVSPLGLIIAPLVLKRNKATNTFYKGVVAAAIICILVSLWGSYAILSTIFNWGTPPTVEYLG